jgi:hypothetical protein
MSDQLREIASPFVTAAPAGARVRTRLRVQAQDEAVLRAVGRHLGSLAGRDLAARVREGRLDARGKAASRRERKRALTAPASSRWAGAITRTSEDQWGLAERNLRAERSSLRARVARIEARIALPTRGRSGRLRGYASPAERHGKVIRLRALQARLAHVERQLESGSVSVVRGGPSSGDWPPRRGDGGRQACARPPGAAKGRRDRPWPEDQRPESCPPSTRSRAHNKERQAPPGPAAATPVAEDRDGQTATPARPGSPRPFGAAR